jgi:hypothetical protein
LSWHGDLAADLNAILASRFSAFKISDIAKSDLGDLAQGLARQESLVRGDHDVWKCCQALKCVVLDNRRRAVCKKQGPLFLIDIDAQIPEVFVALERIDRGARIYERATRGVDEHRAALHQRYSFAVDEMLAVGRQRAMQ